MTDTLHTSNNKNNHFLLLTLVLSIKNQAEQPKKIMLPHNPDCSKNAKIKSYISFVACDRSNT